MKENSYAGSGAPISARDPYPRGLIERLELLRDRTHDTWTTKGQLWFEVMDIIQWVNGQKIDALTRELRLERIERGLPT